MRLVDKVFLGILMTLYTIGTIILIAGVLYYGF
jgi:hypothetical protein